MVAVILTPEIQSVLEALYTKRLVERQVTKTLKELLSQTTIYPTHEDAVIHLIPKTRHPALDERIAHLRRRLENLQYSEMVRDVSRANARDNVQTENLRMNKLAPQMSLAFNVIVTMATCFTAAYYVFKHSTGSKTVGLIAGVVGLIVAMIVEIVLLLTKMYTIDDVLRKKQKDENKVLQKEKKSISQPCPESSTLSTTSLQE